MIPYDEVEFVLYALDQMKIAVLHHEGKYISLANGFIVEVEHRDLYRLSAKGFVISPFDDIGELCTFIKRNGNE